MSKTQRATLATGDWVRASKYMIDGTCIRPAPGSTLTAIDPWKHAADAYASLVELPRRFVSDRDAGIADALAWVGRYGLLGVLPYRTLRVALAPRWRRERFPAFAGLSDTDLRSLWPTRHVYMQRPGGWLTQISSSLPNPDVPMPYSPDADGRLLDKPPAHWKPSVLLRSLETLREPVEEPLSRTWARFFPTVDDVETFDYPCPGTLDFFEIYGEPITEFILAADMLDTALRELQDRSTIPTSVLTLNALGAGVGIVLRQEGGKLRLRRVAGSLLAVLGAQAVEDAANGAVRICNRCNAVFVTNSYQGTYCSPTCRQTMQKRRQRARAKGKGVQ